ncbi:polyubiquitin precursor [Rhizophagus diaphanus]|nr:polyubiquitin precursor [Rhizophagus diaphanus] [Rhizophagus sp. MUCL 43196]
MFIFVKFRLRARIEVNSYDTILQVKNKIKALHDIDVNKQLLHLGNQRLENEGTINDYNIKENDQIRLTLIIAGGFQIFVEDLDGRTTSLQVQSSYTIKKVKELYYERNGLEVGKQRYIFGGQPLLDDRTLSSYNIMARKTINLVYRLVGGFF